MRSEPNRSRSPRAGKIRVLRPAAGDRPDRHILLGVSHSSNDPAQHRVFEVRAVFDEGAGGWIAEAGEQNLNEQRGAWGAMLSDAGLARVLPTAAACLGEAVATIVTMVDREADDGP